MVIKLEFYRLEFHRAKLGKKTSVLEKKKMWRKRKIWGFSESDLSRSIEDMEKKKALEEKIRSNICFGFWVWFCFGVFGAWKWRVGWQEHGFVFENGTAGT